MWKHPDGRDWLWGKLVLAMVGKAMLNKSLIQFFADDWGYVPSLLFAVRPNYGRSNGEKKENEVAQSCLTLRPHGL